MRAARFATPRRDRVRPPTWGGCSRRLSGRWPNRPRRAVSVDTLLQDLRFAIRTLRRSPGVTALAVLCMALGIGSVTTMYSSANAFTFRPLPQVRDPGRLAHVWEAPASAPDRMDGVSAGALRHRPAER